MTSFDPNSILQFAGYGFFVVFMLYGQKIQMYTMLAQVNGKMKRLLFLRNTANQQLRTHIKKFLPAISPEQEARLVEMIDSIAIPPVGHLDPAGLVPKFENIYKTYDRFLKRGLARIVPGLTQAQIENLTNSLEVAIELNMFYKVVEHFVKLAKKAGMLAIYQIVMVLPMLMDMAEALFAASGHFSTGLPIGDGFGPMVAQRFNKNYGDARDVSPTRGDAETTVYELPNCLGRKVYTVKAKGPGGSVGNPGKVTQTLLETVKPQLVITIDAGLKLESENTAEISQGVGVAMGGPGMDRYRIEEALAKFEIPVYTFVCKMDMKQAISQMSKEVLAQVDPVYRLVQRTIQEESEMGDTVVVIGVGNTMGVD